MYLNVLFQTVDTTYISVKTCETPLNLQLTRVKLCAARQWKVVGFFEVKSIYSFPDPPKDMSKPDFPTTQLSFVFGTLVSPPRNGRLSSTFSLFFHLPRCMVSTAQLVLALRKRSRSSQQEWCPTKLYKLLQPAPRLQQQPVQLKTRSRVTECSETQEVITVLFDRTLFSSHLEYVLKA